MPTKDHRDVPALTPEMTYYLMTGKWATVVRLEGVWAAAQAGLWGNPSIEEVWAAHRRALIAEARRAGFVPAGPDGPSPTGRAFRRWAKRFLSDPAHHC